MKALRTSSLSSVFVVLLFLNVCILSVHSNISEDVIGSLADDNLEEVHISPHVARNIEDKEADEEEFEEHNKDEQDEDEEEGSQEVDEDVEEEDDSEVEDDESEDEEDEEGHIEKSAPDNHDDDEHDYEYLPEKQRIKEFHKRYVWPFDDKIFVPNATGFVNTMRKRLDQVAVLDVPNDRYTGFETVATTGFLVPNFTEHGFGLTRCIDDELMDKLRAAVREGLDTAELEDKDEEDLIMPGPNPPLLVNDTGNLLERVAIEMKRYAETWSGMKLLPYGAYGFRVYRNETQLLMHVDRAKSHIISFILHIDHSDDGEPWPLVIEDYHGISHEVSLTSGDLLFYESAKLLHGRPRPLNGSWYCSVFVHYFPVDWVRGKIHYEANIAVPPGWDDEEKSRLLQRAGTDVPRLKLIESGFTEPDCPHQWCGLQNSIKWSGPAEPGVWHAPNFEKYPLNLPPNKYAVEEL